MIDLLYPEPVEDVGHECLEPHVLHASDELSRLEILVSRVTAPFAEVVNKVPGDSLKKMLTVG
jgi:hypothetical protein